MSPGPVPARLAGWGGGPRVTAAVLRAHRADELRAALATHGTPAIARGMGRSYGDAAQLRGGLVLDIRAHNRFALDSERGVVCAQAGVTLGQLLDHLAPEGWLVPVVPGTQHVSVGGAIACDIHGKNHGAVGSFGSHVRRLGLLCADGELRELTRDSDGDVLEATIGGLGLTGIIIWAELALAALPPRAVLMVDTDRVTSLDDALGVLDDRAGGPYRVAWLDLLGRPAVRGVVTRAEITVPGAESPRPAGPTVRATATVASRARIPPRFPGGVLRPELVGAYNELRFRRAPRRAAGRPEPFGAHMFPLDALDAWPRLYGPAGFVQYQLVVPRGAEDVLAQMLERLRASRVPCYLAVLKDLGDESSAPLSFPMGGWTLALDLPRAAQGLLAVLDGFDELVAGAGGRVYLAKDGRLRAETVAAMYPRLEQWRSIRDRIDPERRWRSDLALRTGLVRT